MIKLGDFILFSDKKTVSGRFPIDWTKTFKGIEIAHGKGKCLDCDYGKI